MKNILRKKKRISHQLTNTVGIDKVLNFKVGDKVESSTAKCDGDDKRWKLPRGKGVICWKPESVRKYEETTESKIFEEEEDTNKD